MRSSQEGEHGERLREGTRQLLAAACLHIAKEYRIDSSPCQKMGRSIHGVLQNGWFTIIKSY